MAHWHNDESINQEGAHCGTTHCWAGWIVALAGTEGRKLEEHLGTPVAALRILHASSPIHIGMVRFFETDNEKAMQEIKRCAEAEAQLPK